MIDGQQQHIEMTDRVLGRGSFGVVSYATSVDDRSKEFAVKRIILLKEEDRRIFEKEIEILKKINSVNVVKLRG